MHRCTQVPELYRRGLIHVGDSYINSLPDKTATEIFPEEDLQELYRKARLNNKSVASFKHELVLAALSETIEFNYY